MAQHALGTDGACQKTGLSSLRAQFGSSARSQALPDNQRQSSIANTASSSIEQSNEEPSAPLP
eukprot:2060928-Alexandrium_andersonii.AAC.1